MGKVIEVLLIIHISAGSAALLCGLLAYLFRKKVKTHRPFGKIYFYLMTVVFFTAVFISFYKKNVFLFCVAFFTYHMALTAYRSLKLKQLHKGQKPTRFDWTIELLFFIVHIGFVLLGLYLLIFTLATSAGIISLVFGFIGINNNRLNYTRLKGRIHESNVWLRAHASGMMGSYIGAFTAFLVNNNTRWIHAPALLAWLGPTVIIVPLIILETNKLKKKQSPKA